MTLECMLCCDEVKFFGITECNHGPFCYRCVYKIRAINKNNSCPVCKHESKQVMISKEFNKFGSFQGDILPDVNFGDIFHCGKEAKIQFEKLKEHKCFVKTNGKACKTQKSFENIAFLKKHLKDEHKRVLCDICLEKKTCTLEQQKLYTTSQLQKHLSRGDIDESGNVIFLHPFCAFCKVHFFDEDEFKRHMGLEHLNCHVCGNDHRYNYYKNYDSLETHYKITHYICSEDSCLAKKFIAFRSAEQLKIHRIQIHSVGNKKIDGKQLCSFNYGGVASQQIIEIKDKEGINMQEQFLTLKKSKNRAIGQADQQRDTVIDVRDFYNCVNDQDDHYHNVFIVKRKNAEDNKQKSDNNQKAKKKYVQKQQFEKQRPIYAKQNQDFTIQDLSLLKSLHLSNIHPDDFQRKLQNLLGVEDGKKLETFRVKNSKRQMSSQQLLNNFYDLMRKVSLKTGYQLFPHYIRTLKNEVVKQQLNEQYIKSLKKLPSKVNSLISKCKTYGNLFQQLIKQIEKNIETRIRSQRLSIKKPIKRQKQRLFQLIGVVRRLKTQQMAKFKFASNFGVKLETTQIIIQALVKKNINELQSVFDKIENEQLIDLYVFSKFCFEAINHNESMHQTKNNIHQQVLQDYLFERPELYKQFGIKKQQMKTLQEQVLYEKQMEERNHKKTLKDMQKKGKNMGITTRTNFNIDDKSDFPDLLPKQQQTINRKQQLKDLLHQTKNKPATYTKKINELFPTLGQSTAQKEEDTSKKETVHVKKQQTWWQKINEPVKSNVEEQQVVKIRKGKNKKEKWVSGKGFFQ